MDVIKNRAKNSQHRFFRAEARPAEGQELCDTHQQRKSSPLPAPGFGWQSKVWLQRRCLLAGTWRQAFENLPFNKIDLMRSSAPFGMLITKQPGEKCLGIKGVATLVLFCFGFLVREPADICQSLATKNQQTLARAWLPSWPKSATR